MRYHPPSRLRRVLISAGLVRCVLMGAAGAGSVVWPVGYSRGRTVLKLSEGSVWVYRHSRHIADLLEQGPSVDWDFDDDPSIMWLPGVVRTWWLGTVVNIPLWIPLVVLAVLTAVLWSRDRRPPKGFCQRCGYNLTGLTEPRCPECGEVI